MLYVNEYLKENNKDTDSILKDYKREIYMTNNTNLTTKKFNNVNFFLCLWCFKIWDTRSQKYNTWTLYIIKVVKNDSKRWSC